MNQLVLIAVVLACLATIGTAEAQNDAAVTGAAVGTAAGVAAANASHAPAAGSRDVPGFELSDWIDPKTGSTSRLIYGCGAIAEFRLSGFGGTNYLVVDLTNESDSPISLDRREVTVQFASGLKRRLASFGAEGVTLDPGWWISNRFVFPDKRDFRGQDAMVVTIPIVKGDPHGPACALRANLERAAGVPPNPATYTPHTRFEVMFGLGGRVASSSGPKALDGDRGVSLDFGFYLYPWLHHGFFLDFVLDFYGSDAVRRVAPTAVLGERPSVSGAGFMPGYMYRFYAAPWLTVSYSAAFGPYVLELTDKSDSGPIVQRAIFSLRQRLRVGFRLWQPDDGGELDIAPTLVHTYIPYGQFGEVQPAGSTLTASVQLVIGF